jgi:hypothetical protein
MGKVLHLYVFVLPEKSSKRKREIDEGFILTLSLSAS